MARGEFFSLLGPSGCGKTTLLRLIAGLDFPDAGELKLAGRDVARVPAHERQVNTVFQSYALFPHLNVRENVSFGLRMKKVARAEIETRDIPVVMLSADATPNQIERLRAAGAVEYMTKPLDVKRFLQVLQEILEKDTTN